MHGTTLNSRPNSNKVGTMQPTDYKRCSRRTRFTEMLPISRDKFVYSFRRRLSDLCREYDLDFASGEGIVFRDIRDRQIRRCTQ